MSLILLGLNHKTAPVEVRERLSISDRDIPALLASLHELDSVRGAAVLSTCNRVEILLSTRDEDAIEPVVDVVSAKSRIGREELESHLYVLRHSDVIRHVFRVASGLDSMILGEPQIGGQMRDAFVAARQLESLDPLLHKLYETTFRVAKKVRTDTGIGESAVSIPYAAVELARKIFGDLSEKRVLLVGAGEMGELTAAHLSTCGVAKISVTNRGQARAEDLAHRFSAEVVEFERFEECLDTTDIVVVATAAPDYVLTRAEIQRVMKDRRANLFLIDLSVPRNIDPGISRIQGAYLYNVDDLKEVTNANLERRAIKAGVAETIIEQEVDAFIRRLSAEEAVPTILQLQDRLEEIRRGEIERCLRRLGPVSSEQRDAIEALSRGIINKVLHYPVLRLKESAAEEQQPEGIRDTILRIFGLR